MQRLSATDGENVGEEARLIPGLMAVAWHSEVSLRGAPGESLIAFLCGNCWTVVTW